MLVPSNVIFDSVKIGLDLVGEAESVTGSLPLAFVKSQAA